MARTIDATAKGRAEKVTGRGKKSKEGESESSVSTDKLKDQECIYADLSTASG